MQLSQTAFASSSPLSRDYLLLLSIARLPRYSGAAGAAETRTFAPAIRRGRPRNSRCETNHGDKPNSTLSRFALSFHLLESSLLSFPTHLGSGQRHEQSEEHDPQHGDGIAPRQRRRARFARVAVNHAREFEESGVPVWIQAGGALLPLAHRCSSFPGNSSSSCMLFLQLRQ